MPKRNRRKHRKQLQANSRRSDVNVRDGNNGYRQTGSYHHADIKRNVWDVAGYPTIVTFNMHWHMFSRFGIAKAGIHKIVNKCWQTLPKITDGEFDGKRGLTNFEKDVETLIEKHSLYTRLKGLDWRQRVGRYAGLLPIVKEQTKSSPGNELAELKGIESVLKLVPVFESQIAVENVGTITDLDSARYGMPTHYNYREEVAGDRNPPNNKQFELHPSRVFVFAEGADDGSIYGTPANEAGYNALMDLEKTIASGAEGLFKNAKQRTVANIKDGAIANVISNDEAKRAKWEQSADDFASGFDTMLTTYGMDINSLQSTLADPTNPFTIALNTYAASIEIPASELIGVQMNRQASEGNANALNESADSRRATLLTPMIKDFLNYMVDIGAVSKPTNKIEVTWDLLVEPNQETKLDSGKKMQDINKSAFDSGAGEPIYTEQEIRKTSGFDAEKEGELEEFNDDED